MSHPSEIKEAANLGGARATRFQDPDLAEPLRRIVAGRAAVTLLPRAAYEARYTPARTVIGFAFDSQSGEHAFASDRIVAFRTPPGSFAVTPAGCDVYSRSSAGGEYLTLEWDGFDWADAPFNARIDAAAIQAARALRRLALQGACEALELEAPALALLDRLAPRAAPAAGAMTGRRRRLFEEMVEARLGEPLSVTDLASALGLSDGHFARAVKAGYGVSPFDYVLERRIARARRLLASGRASIAEIAFETGFSSHAHLSAAFRRRLGAPPSLFRPG